MTEEEHQKLLEMIESEAKASDKINSLNNKIKTFTERIEELRIRYPDITPDEMDEMMNRMAIIERCYSELEDFKA